MAHHDSTPQRILDAPVSEPIQVWPPPPPKKSKLQFTRTARRNFGPYTTDKVRKVRKGRKARWNR